MLIAHRSSTLRLADRVIVLDGGRIVAEGTNAELSHTSALYRELLLGPELPAAAAAAPVVDASIPTPGRRASPMTAGTSPQVELASIVPSIATAGGGGRPRGGRLPGRPRRGIAGAAGERRVTAAAAG